MKIFGYEFRKFEKESTTLETIETWVVEWNKLERDIISRYDPKPMFKTFINRGQAIMFKKEIEDCIKLLGDRGRSVKLYRQKSPTNK